MFSCLHCKTCCVGGVDGGEGPRGQDGSLRLQGQAVGQLRRRRDHQTKGMGFDSLIKKENKIFLIYEEIQSGAVAKSYMRKGLLHNI